MPEHYDYAIDLGRILASKFKGRRIPGWLVRLFERFFHTDFLNGILTTTPGSGVSFCRHSVECLGLELEISGLDNVPLDGTRYTFASNHPLGGADGVSLCSVIGERFGDVKMPVNDFLMYLKPLAPICIPVNKVGNQARDLPRLLDDAFRSDSHILYFPSGKCSRMIDGHIADPIWLKTFVRKSRETGRCIVPVHFIGENSRRFYRITNIAKALGIKFNIGMLFLPNELYNSRNKKYRIVFGKPVRLPSGETVTDAELSERIRTIVYNLQ